MLIGSILAETATKFPDKLAIICGEDSLTYAELEKASNCLANALIREDLAKGHNIAILQYFLVRPSQAGCLHTCQHGLAPRN